MTAAAPPLRWGILSTARISRSSFLPALRQSGDEAVVVGSRDLRRGEAYAAQEGVGRAVASYDEVVESPDIDAVYVPLPNHLHATWSARALRAGKAVLCEKPLSRSVPDVEALLAVARETGAPLWEAFVFPFHDQTRRIRDLLDDGAIGAVTGLSAQFHFRLDDPDDIRFEPSYGAGALYDVGCYPIRFARAMLGDLTVDGATGTIVNGVDTDVEAALRSGTGVGVRVAASFTRDLTVGAVIEGERGRIEVAAPYHPTGPETTLVERSTGDWLVRSDGPDRPFLPALRHIRQAVRGEAEPRQLAVDTALGNAIAIDGIRSALGLPIGPGDETSSTDDRPIDHPADDAAGDR